MPGLGEPYQIVQMWYKSHIIVNVLKNMLDSTGVVETKIETQQNDSTNWFIALNFIWRCPSLTAALPANIGGCIPTGAAMPGLGEPYQIVQMWYKSTIDYQLCVGQT